MAVEYEKNNSNSIDRNYGIISNGIRDAGQQRQSWNHYRTVIGNVRKLFAAHRRTVYAIGFDRSGKNGQQGYKAIDQALHDFNSSGERHGYKFQACVR